MKKSMKSKLMKELIRMVVMIENYEWLRYKVGELVKEVGVGVDVVGNEELRIEELEEYDKMMV